MFIVLVLFRMVEVVVMCMPIRNRVWSNAKKFGGDGRIFASSEIGNPKMESSLVRSGDILGGHSGQCCRVGKTLITLLC